MTTDPNLRAFTVTMNAKTCDGQGYTPRDLADVIIGEHLFADVDVTETTTGGGYQTLSADPGMKSCAHCLWDIRRDDEGRWRLAYGGSDDPWTCEGRPEGHEPGRLENGRMVLLGEPEATAP